MFLTMPYKCLSTDRRWLTIFGLSTLFLLTQGQDENHGDPFHTWNSREWSEEYKCEMTSSIHPIFKRFIARVLEEISKFEKSDSPKGMDYDAMVHLPAKSLAELQKVVDEKPWTPDSLDEALSKIVVKLKPHNRTKLQWPWTFFENTPELYITMKMGIFVVLIVMIICTELWSKVSWFVQFWRMFAICFFISVIWNWFYLYKTAFAEHQSNLVKMEPVRDRCTGVKTMNWMDTLSEWYRSTLTIQDDPCKKYYELLLVNPLLLVPPHKAIVLTITTFFTEPLKHFGQGINEFTRALLKDLPITIQIILFFTTVLCILVCICVSVPTAIQHVFTYPLRDRRDTSNRSQDCGQHPEHEMKKDPDHNEDAHRTGGEGGKS